MSRRHCTRRATLHLRRKWWRIQGGHGYAAPHAGGGWDLPVPAAPEPMRPRRPGAPLDPVGGLGHAGRVRDLLERLAALRARDPGLQVFGAGAHRYGARPADELAVARFEQRHGVRLPRSFRQLVLGVTDGGAGPGYGLFALERGPDDDVAEDLAQLGTPFDHDAYFNLEPPDVDPDEDEAAYEAAMNEYWRELPGTMTLCHYGCAIRAQLVVTGALAGQVIIDQRCDQAGVYPFTRATGGRYNAWDRPPDDDRAPLDVLAWYRDWLDANLALLAR